MKTYFIPILLTCVFFATIYPLQAQQSIYVSPTGNDRNAGTKEAPIASLPAAIKIIETSTEQDITLFLQNGTYHLEKPLTFSPDILTGKRLQITTSPQSDSVIISGSKKLSLQWKKGKHGLWEAQTEDSFEQLWINGSPRILSLIHICNGANRYDGYEFVVYQNEVNNNATLTDNYIRGFAEDNRKNIWIATSNGINCIDYKTKKITRFYPKSINKECTTNIINRLLKHSDGNVYAFCNRSVFKCSMNQTVETVFPDIAIPSPTYSVAQAPDKDIYIGTESNGLYIRCV